MTATVSESFPSLLAAALTGIFLFVVIVCNELRSVFGQSVSNFRNQKEIGVFPGIACLAGTFFIHTYCFFLLRFALEEHSATHRNCAVYKFINDKLFVEYKDISFQQRFFNCFTRCEILFLYDKRNDIS